MNFDSIISRDGQRHPASISQLSSSKSFSGNQKKISLSQAPLLRLNSIGEVTGIEMKTSPKKITSSTRPAGSSPAHQIDSKSNMNKLRLSKSFSLPEVSYVPSINTESSKCRHPSLSSSFESSLIHQCALKSFGSCVENCDNRVLPDIVKNLFLGAMQRPSDSGLNLSESLPLSLGSFLALNVDVCNSVNLEENCSVKDNINTKIQRSNVSSKECESENTDPACYCKNSNLENASTSIRVEGDFGHNEVSNIDLEKCSESSICDKNLPPKNNSINLVSPVIKDKNMNEIDKSLPEATEIDKNKVSDHEKEHADLSSVLYQRKSSTKKGRPSCRKRYKRQREKLRTYCKNVNEDLPNKVLDSMTISPPQKIPSAEENNSPLRDNDSPNSSLSSLCLSSTPESNPKFKGLAAQFILTHSDIESSSGESGECSDDSWSDYEDKESPAVEFQCLGMDFVKFHKTPETSLVYSVGSCDSVEFVSSPKGSDINQSSEENSFIEFSGSPTFEFINLNTEKEVSSYEEFEENMKEVNARWHRHYPAGCFCRQQSPSSTLCCSIKVSFAENLVTAEHIVGSEDRRGEWMSCAIDRERFGRYIQQCSEAISPILDETHRKKVYERNCQLVTN